MLPVKSDANASSRPLAGSVKAVIASYLARIGLGPRSAARRGDHHKLGDAGEAYAAKWLKQQGYKVLRRNAHTPTGEIDIVARAPDKQTIVIVEVKTREPLPGQPRPERQVDQLKLRKLVVMLDHLTRANAWHDRPRRIDVIGIDWPRGGQPALRHHQGVYIAPLKDRQAR